MKMSARGIRFIYSSHANVVVFKINDALPPWVCIKASFYGNSLSFCGELSYVMLENVHVNNLVIVIDKLVFRQFKCIRLMLKCYFMSIQMFLSLSTEDIKQAKQIFWHYVGKSVWFKIVIKLFHSVLMPLRPTKQLYTCSIWVAALTVLVTEFKWLRGNTLK